MNGSSKEEFRRKPFPQPPAHLAEASRFRGWLPTVSGRLSFTVFGHTLFPTRAITANLADLTFRCVVTYQRIYGGDTPWGLRRLVRLLAGYRANFIFIFIGSVTDDGEYLVGTTYILDDAVSPWRNVVRPAVRELQSNLRAADGHLRHIFEDKRGHLEDILRKTANFYATVIIARSGTTEIVVPFPNTTYKSAPALPTDPMKRRDVVHILAAQIFFFVRNLGHHHQHHSPETDTIIDIHGISDTDDSTWRLKTLYSMYRAVIEYKRNPHSGNFNNCLGIIAYASTFLNICGEELPADRRNLLPAFYKENLADSIRATQAQLDRETAIRTRRRDLVRNLLLAILSVFLSFAGLLRLTSTTIYLEPDPLIIGVVTFVLTHSLQSIALAGAVIIAFVMASTVRYRDILPIGMRALLRVGQAMPRGVTIALLFCIAAAAITVIFWLIARDFASGAPPTYFTDMTPG